MILVLSISYLKMADHHLVNPTRLKLRLLVWYRRPTAQAHYPFSGINEARNIIVLIVQAITRLRRKTKFHLDRCRKLERQRIS